MTNDEQHLATLKEMVIQVAAKRARLEELKPALDEADSLKNELNLLESDITNLANGIATRSPNYGY